MKHNYIKIHGYITVLVDAVDIEQIAIEMPGIADDHIRTKAFAAAQEKEGFKSILRVMMQSGFTLDPDDYKYAGGGAIEVTFITREMLQKDEAAA